MNPPFFNGFQRGHFFATHFFASIKRQTYTIFDQAVEDLDPVQNTDALAGAEPKELSFPFVLENSRVTD